MSDWKKLRYGIYAIILLGEIVAIKIFYGWDFGFATAWAAIVATVIGVASWAEKNRTEAENDTQRLTDSQRDKLAEVATRLLKKTYQAHEAIVNIAHSEFYSFDEIKKARETFEIKDGEGHNDALVMAYRMHGYNEFFVEYRAMEIDAKIYFSDYVADLIKKMCEVVAFIRVQIRNANNPVRKNNQADHIDAVSGFALNPPDVGGIEDSDLERQAQKYYQLFKSICQKMENELIRYIRGEEK